MRLQNLEIFGFKSFPERANLAFDDGVTAIVGPNGCGKSNVIDAITWVLGEQSAKSLRGERMEDVIFSGSDARKPTGTAEVKLFLAKVNAAPGMVGGVDAQVDEEAAAPAATDDEDVDDLLPLITRDVEVGRRLYRSGESEYLIDGKVCRLRDVQDLLMDSGVGVKAYAVIEQGKIGQILGARPTERRQLLEEAAGVTKYKSRRRAAELKLEAAEQNLTRVDDIIYEVEKQRRSLKRQAAKARRYRRLREELRRWETVGFARRQRALADAIEAARRRLEAARERDEAAAAELARVEGERERCQIELTEAETGATSARDAAHARELEVERRQQQITYDSQQIDTLAVTLTELGEELEDLRARREPARRELDAHAADAERCGTERDEVGTTLRRKEQSLVEAQQALEGLEGDVEAARNEVFAVINAVTALRHAVEHATAGQTRLGEVVAKLDAESRDLAMETESLDQARRQASDEERTTRGELERLESAISARDAELASLRNTRETRVGALREREQQLAALDGRLTSLRDLEKSRAGYSDAARSLLADGGAGVRHLGAVADHLEVDPGLERGVEACLGDLLQHVIVASRADAQAGLEAARRHGAGRVGFLVADAPVEAATPAFPAPGVRPVSDVVRVSGPDAAAIRSALAGHWLADSFEAAAQAALEMTAPVASPEGDVFRGRTLVSGGASEDGLGILATKRELRELEGRIETERYQVEGLNAEITQLRSTVRQTEEGLEQLQEERHQQEKALLGHEMQRAAHDEDADRLERKREVIEIERRTTDEELSALDTRRTDAETSIARLEAEQRAADEKLTAAQRRVLDARESIDTLGTEVAEAKAAHAALVERASALEATALRLELAGQELEGRLERRTADHERAGTERTALIDTVAGSKQQLDADIAGLTDLRAAVQTADEQVLSLRASLESREGEVREARTHREEMRSHVAELDVARATAESDLGHLEESCRDTLQMSLAEVTTRMTELEAEGLVSADVVNISIEPSAGEEDDEAAGEAQESDSEAVSDDASTRLGPMSVEESIAALKDKIDRMGPVNMMAIEEFDDLDERYEFLTTQRQDLVESIRATGDAIARINRTTRERFREAFDAINLHFQKTFSTLFGGGRAGLVLLDESDLLESGIDIIAQPPGKRLQSIQLLSGGEKALSAMALMFAIFKYRPSPFCLLDEIDAPLDEANIGRFVQMLRGMQTDTQFILVTHNRKTMEIADRMYGVTMEEPGVSKLISVQLGQA